jgi:tripartite-type tricarboxylate transporter receptor subunit TctC
MFGTTQYILVVSRSEPADSLKALIASLKAKPGQFSYASAGVGSPNHLAAELFKLRAGVSVVHVPYKGGAPAALAVLSGEVKLLFASFSSAMPQLKAGGLRALAVTGPTRSTEIPDVPTIQESGFPGFDVRAWFGLLAPAGTPVAIVTRLNRESLSMLAQSEVKDAYRREGLETSGSTPQEFAARIKSEKGLWAKVIREAGIKPE